MKNSPKLFFAFVTLFFSLIFSLSASGQTADRTDDHAALRALLVKGAEALNTRNFDSIMPSLHPNFTVVTVDNQKLVGADAFKKYYLGLFEGPGALVNKIETKPVADELTQFVGDNTGITYGTSQDTFHFKDGEVRTMPTRWSAVAQKDNGTWKLVNIHFSANLMDNPALAAAKSYAGKIAAGSGILGLLIGLASMTLLRRRPVA